MSYAPGLDEFVDRCNSVMPPEFHTFPLERQRALYLELVTEFPYELPPGVEITDEIVHHAGRAFPVRVYRPERATGTAAVLYIRGGGFVMGSLETHQTVVAELADITGLVAIALDFRMAPEYPFPAAIEDCYGSLCGVAGEAARLGIDPDRIVISGDSSGANMAVAVAMITRDRKGPALCGQALISPVLDFTRWRHGGGDAPLLTGGEMEFYTACYVPDPHQLVHPYVSPVVSGGFHGLPPAYVMGAELDPLLVDSERYAQLLRAAGTEVTLVTEPGLVHSAVRARGLSPAVADAWQRFCHQVTRLASGEREPRVA